MGRSARTSPADALKPSRLLYADGVFLSGPNILAAGRSPDDRWKGTPATGSFGMDGETMSKDEARAEYLDVSANLRHWNTLRFAELTIYIAIMSGMTNIAFGGSPETPFGLPALTASVRCDGLGVWRIRCPGLVGLIGFGSNTCARPTCLQPMA